MTGLGCVWFGGRLDKIGLKPEGLLTQHHVVLLGDRIDVLIKGFIFLLGFIRYNRSEDG